MNMWLKINSYWFSSLLAVSLWLGASLANTEAAPLKIGDPFPTLGEFQLEGKMPAETKGKVVLVDFWASWCGPCKASFQTMEELHQQYSGKGLVILAINLDEKAAAMQEFLSEHKVSFPIVRDGGQRLVKSVKIATMPTSFLIDQQGKVRFIHKGYHGGQTKKEYTQEIEQLLADNSKS